MESDFRMSNLPSVLDFYLCDRAPGITTSEEKMIYLGSRLQNYLPVFLGSVESGPEELNFGSTRLSYWLPGGQEAEGEMPAPAEIPPSCLLFRLGRGIYHE